MKSFLSLVLVVALTSSAIFALRATAAPAAVPSSLADQSLPDVALSADQSPAAPPLATMSSRFATFALMATGAIALAVALHKALVNALLTGRLRLSRRTLVPAINTLPANVGSSKNKRRYKASGALATRYLFVKAGADDEHVAAIAATADKPLGVITDEAAAAEDPVDVELCGINGRTLPCVAGAAIATLNLDMYTTSTGKVVGKPTAAGTYWKVGRNLTLADADADPVEVELCEPEKLTIIVALTSSNGTAAAAIPGALTSTNGTAAAAIPGALTVGADIGVFTDPPSAGEMATLRTFVNALKADVAAIHAADLLAQAEAEKIGDDARAIHAAALLAQAEAEKIGDDVRAIAVGLSAAGGGVATATS